MQHMPAQLTQVSDVPMSPATPLEPLPHTAGEKRRRAPLLPMDSKPRPGTTTSSRGLGEAARGRIQRSGSFDATWNLHDGLDDAASGARKSISRSSSMTIPCTASEDGEIALASWYLEQENQILREQLASYQSTSVPQRRSMAAIAGGGFRAPVSGAQKQCMCNSLRSKLSRTRTELMEARYQAMSQQLESTVTPSSTNVVHSSMQTSPRASPRPRSPQKQDAQIQVSGMQQLVNGATQTVQADPVSTQSMETQCESTATAEVGLQVAASEVVVNEACCQTDAPPIKEPVADAETQATPLEIPCSSSSTQTLPAPESCERFAQTSPRQCPTVEVQECAVQVSASCFSASTFVQTEQLATVSVATQVVPPRGIARGCQVEDKEEKRRMLDQTNKIRELEEKVKALTVQKLSSDAQHAKLLQDTDTWRQAALKNTLGQMNITILCPRAECTVSGSKIEMDSWSPAKLKAEFERDVLPRFARIFVEDSSKDASCNARGRSEAVERAMQEFVEVFRERLSSLLSAPNGAAAFAAAQTRAGTR